MTCKWTISSMYRLLPRHPTHRQNGHGRSTKVNKPSVKSTRGQRSSGRHSCSGRKTSSYIYFANMAKIYGMVPLMEDGSALTQPVWAVDVAKTISRIIDDPEKFSGRTVDCFGPSDYSYEELAKFVLDLTEQNRPIVHLPKRAFLAMANAMSYQSFVLMNPDIAELWSHDFFAGHDAGGVQTAASIGQDPDHGGCGNYGNSH